MFTSERDFQAAVVACARLGGWAVFHVIDSRKSTGVGYPDLTMVHRQTGRLLFVELKVGRNQPTAEQTDWLTALGIRHTAVVWRPTDWQSDRIQQLLLGERRAAA